MIGAIKWDTRSLDMIKGLGAGVLKVWVSQHCPHTGLKSTIVLVVYDGKTEPSPGANHSGVCLRKILSFAVSS